MNNLEWVTVYENIEHAIKEGLVPSAFPVKVRDFSTGDITEYPSVTRACRAIGCKYPVNLKKIFNTNPNRLFLSRYEFKFLDDESEWKRVEYGNEKTAMLVITILDTRNGTITRVFGREEFNKKYRIWNTHSIADAITKLHRRHPYLRAIYQRQWDTREVQTRNIETGEVSTYVSIREASRKTGVTRGSIKDRLKSGDVGYPANNFQFRYPSKNDWPTPQKRKGEAKKILCCSEEDIIFNSLREAAEKLNLSRFKIKKACERSESLNGMLFSYIT